jgi:hypothetical protein
MVTANTPLPLSLRRIPVRDRVTAGSAAALSVLGMIGVIALMALALLVVPVAAALVFGPALLQAI